MDDRPDTVSRRRGIARALPRRLRRFSRDRRGGASVAFGLASMALLGMAGIAVDSAYLYRLKTQLQIAADAAAFAAVRQLPDQDTARADAITYATRNLPTAEHGATVTDDDVVFGRWETDTRTFTPGGTPTNAVEVRVLRAQANGNPAIPFFFQIFGFDAVDISARSLTSMEAGQPGCILALDPGSTSKALEFSSMDSVELNDCTPVANSTHNEAIKLGSLDRFHAGSLYTAGNYRAGSIGSLNLDQPAQTGQPPVADPYAYLAEPSPGVCDYPGASGSGTLWPGTYCGDIDVSGSVTLNPGTYYVVNGDLEFSSGNVSCNCSAPGAGVTFVLTGSGSSIGTFDFGSINSLSLQAPADPSYDYPGILIYVDRDSPLQESKFSSIDNLTFNGAIYAPTQQLTYSSIDWSSHTDCSLIVGYRIKFNSIDAFGKADNCAEYGTQTFGPGMSSPSLVD